MPFLVARHFRPLLDRMAVSQELSDPIADRPDMPPRCAQIRRIPLLPSHRRVEPQQPRCHLSGQRPVVVALREVNDRCTKIARVNAITM